MSNQDDDVYRKILEVFSGLVKRLHILYDPLFKKYFLNNPYILEYYLLWFFALFRVQGIAKLVYGHNEIPPKIHATDLKQCGKAAVADLLGTCTWISQNGTHFETYFNCETQQHFSDDDKKRVYYYEASQYTAQIKRGQSYKNIRPVTTLIFAHTASFARDNGHYIQTLPRYTDDWHYDEQEPEAYKVLIVLSRVPESTLTLKTATPADNFLYFMKKPIH